MTIHRASISDLAAQLNLSVSTVSRALSNNSRISEATKQRVWELARQLHYQPNHLAAALRKGRSNTIGVVIPHIDGQFFALVVKGIETLANQAGFNVMICQSNENVAQEQKNIEALLNAQVDGILVSLSLSTHDFQHLEEVRRRGIPLVFFDRIMESEQVSAVVLDDYQGGYDAVCHLLEQGCQQIAHLGGPQHLNICKNRYQGYVNALRKYGQAVNPDLIHFSDLSMQDGRDGMAMLLKKVPHLDGVFACNDLALVGAMQMVKRQGLRIPQDVALAGFSNELFDSLTEPMLTSVDQRCEEMGRTAVELLLEMITAGKHPVTPRHVVLQPTLLIRGSSQRVPAGSIAV
ncbi:transcriptional regulator, LacI family [Hymenobacter daecheongensis DSM 21074]|uniref:Transcriptional regulator, LacI family n=1 Tax=Hymenobacter daecheongensis DSM 21074 TaxID=1121955 RepID=A0A1M6II97_9BACT|nr:LacI family DNA-binding transcriptional regulator [Hymenobacter daecheongensis]SHJ34145.1 transcriptional regulator, LacI family [Hymenobacter daecheongensis DSM 21074]